MQAFTPTTDEPATGAKPSARPRGFTVAEVAEEYGVKQHVVLTWIKTGELGAIDVRAAGASRPKWRIKAAHLEAFELRRAAVPESLAPAPKKKAANTMIDPETGKVRSDFLAFAAKAAKGIIDP